MTLEAVVTLFAFVSQHQMDSRITSNFTHTSTAFFWIISQLPCNIITDREFPIQTTHEKSSNMLFLLYFLGQSKYIFLYKIFYFVENRYTPSHCDGGSTTNSLHLCWYIAYTSRLYIENNSANEELACWKSPSRYSCKATSYALFSSSDNACDKGEKISTCSVFPLTCTRSKYTNELLQCSFVYALTIVDTP